MMAQSRVYRHDIHCPDFGFNWMRQNGFSNGRHIYRGGDCQRICTPGEAYRRPGKALKAQGIARYPECDRLGAVGRLLG